MQTLTPLAQEGAENPETAGDAIVAAPEPLFSGPAPALWAGVGGFIIIFVVVLMLIIRGRVMRPNPRKTKHAPPNYFEPAGEHAEIVFDNDEAHATENDRRWADDAEEEADEIIAQRPHDGRHGGDLMETEREEPEVRTEALAQQKKKSAFAGLFAKKPEKQPDELREEVIFSEPEPEPLPEPVHAPLQSHAALPSPASDARIAQLEDAAQQALQRAGEAEKLARDLARANANTERTIALGLQENEAALSAMSERLTALAKEFQTRLETAARAPQLHDAHEGLSEAHFAEFADLIGEQFESLRGAVNEAIDRLSRRIDHLPAAAPHAVAPTAARVQLSDLLSDALPPQRYELGRKLSSGRTADACIHMPGRLAAIAVDARFPVEAFDAWQRARRETSALHDAETELRRIILRHIADAGERLILSGETADCAMMFIPSEHILSELHAHFPDLVQEGYRAKVWMVAPTSLMATLHTISAVMAGSGLAKAHTDGASDDVARELVALRERIDSLEAARRGNGGQERREPPPEQSQLATVEPAYYGDFMEDRPPHREPQPAESKPPFPLR